MKQKTFYRVEYGDTGWGMWTKESGATPIRDRDDLSDLYYRHYDMPNYSSDKVISKYTKDICSEDYKWRFCFKSLESLKYWIKQGEIKILIDSGYKFFEIESDDYIESKHQAIINKNFISKIDITHTFL